MSRLSLQRVMILMLFDPEYAEAVLRDPSSAPAAESLTEEERRWLSRPDPRAWRIDPERPLRSLSVLLQEYPASAALAVASGGGPERVQRFFSSSHFRRVVLERGSMGPAFEDYLARLVDTGEVADQRIVPLARLERAIQRLRRGNGASDPPASARSGAEPSDALPIRYRLSSDKALHTANAGTADLHDEIHLLLAASGHDLPQAVLEARGSMTPLSTDSSRTELLLLELVADEGPRMRSPVGVAEVSAELYTILCFATVPRTQAGLEAEAVRLGADPDGASETVEGLIEEGVLIETH